MILAIKFLQPKMLMLNNHLSENLTSKSRESAGKGIKGFVLQPYIRKTTYENLVGVGVVMYDPM